MSETIARPIRALQLMVRTPRGLLLDAAVASIVAEDRTGWFGIRPGREDLVAMLPPGLLIWRDTKEGTEANTTGEGFIALSGGMLSLEGRCCRVLASEAVVSRDLDAIARVVSEHIRRRGERASRERGVIGDLAKQAMVTLVRAVRK